MCLNAYAHVGQVPLHLAPPRPKPVLVWLSFFKHKLPIAPAGPFHQMAPAGSNVPRPLQVETAGDCVVAALRNSAGQHALGLKCAGTAKQGTMVGGCGMMMIRKADEGEGVDGMVAVKFEPLKSGLVLLADDQDQQVISITDVFKAKGVSLSSMPNESLTHCIYGYQPTLNCKRDRINLAKPSPLVAESTKPIKDFGPQDVDINSIGSFALGTFSAPKLPAGLTSVPVYTWSSNVGNGTYHLAPAQGGLLVKLQLTSDLQLDNKWSIFEPNVEA